MPRTKPKYTDVYMPKSGDRLSFSTIEEPTAGDESEKEEESKEESKEQIPFGLIDGWQQNAEYIQLLESSGAIGLDNNQMLEILDDASLKIRADFEHLIEKNRRLPIDEHKDLVVDGIDLEIKQEIFELRNYIGI